MFVKQLSVFIENREGRLEQVTEVLKEENINILSLSMADTTEYGMLRMVVSDPERARTALRSKGFSAMLTDVLAVKLEDHVGELHKMTHILCSKGLNIEYMYALAPEKTARHDRQGLRWSGSGQSRLGRRTASLLQRRIMLVTVSVPRKIHWW